MPNLIILGNLNQFTFANSIIASNEKAKELFNNPLQRIFVIHSVNSKEKLDEVNEWKDHIKKEEIDFFALDHKVLEFDNNEKSIIKFVEQVEFILRGVKNSSEIIIDLSNGTTVQKNLLSILGYILDIKHQFMIDIAKLSKLTNNREFIKKEILLQSYITPPDTTLLDNIAYLNLSEMLRYKRIINIRTKNYLEVNENDTDDNFFRDNLIRSIELKLDGDLSKDNATYRIAASSIASSIEELISQLIRKYIGEVGKQTLGQKIQIVDAQVKRKQSQDFDLEFFQLFNQFMLHLRNSTTHKGRLLSDVEKFKAELSVKMSFPYIDFYTDIVQPILGEKNNSEKEVHRINLLEKDKIDPKDKYYYGLDGDDTGKFLEEIFIEAGDEQKFRKISSSIKTAIDKIAKRITNKEGKKAIVFEAGDDLLFKGSFSYEELEAFQKLYIEETGGLTCSIGYGKSFREVYLALKLAKSQPGKNSTIGINIL